MRVLIVTGSFPPMKCGVGDYTYHLVKALAARQDTQIAVLTSLSPESCEDPFDVDVLRVMSNWSILNVRNLSVFWRCVYGFSPDIIHFQYPTQGYNGRLAKILPLMLRFLGFPVVQTWHEHFSECSQIGWLNLVACDALIYVRPDLPSKLPAWVTNWLSGTPLEYVPNASTIPAVLLSSENALAIKQELSGGKPIVCYFGFAYPNKGVERIFEIADPNVHHLVFICDLNEQHYYQANILKLVNKAPWAGNVTVTGFQSAQRVGEILAIADAVIFPFPGGAGEWNTTLKAAEAAGVFTLATTQDLSLLGYHEKRNIYFAGCEKVLDMREALSLYLGKRVAPKFIDEWSRVASDHERIYRSVVNRNKTCV